jgi:hypothetical protein
MQEDLYQAGEFRRARTPAQREMLGMRQPQDAAIGGGLSRPNVEEVLIMSQFGLRRLRKLPLLQLALQCAYRDSQRFCGLRPVSVVYVESLLHSRPFDIGQRINFVPTLEAALRFVMIAQRAAKIIDPQRIGVLTTNHLLEAVAKLADVSRPGVLYQQAHQFRVERGDGPAVCHADLFE